MDVVRTVLQEANIKYLSCGAGVLHVDGAALFEALQLLRDHPQTDFTQMMDLCGVDYPSRRPRFDVVYQLLSLRFNTRLTVVVSVEEEIAVPSITKLYPCAAWFERECYDMFGLVFEGHEDLRRILTDYDFEGFPLRRDFPLSGFTQVRYDDLTRQVIKEPVSLDQDYRAFEAQSPWRGVAAVQKRGAS